MQMYTHTRASTHIRTSISNSKASKLARGFVGVLAPLDQWANQAMTLQRTVCVCVCVCVYACVCARVHMQACV